MSGHPYTRDFDISETDTWRVEQILRQVPLADEASSHEDSLSEEEQVPTRKKRPLKSGMVQTGATMVVNSITWPHKVL